MNSSPDLFVIPESSHAHKDMLTFLSTLVLAVAFNMWFAKVEFEQVSRLGWSSK